jgi:hypothetical protein
LAVCNAGLASGLSREQLLQLVLPFGPVKNVILIPGKSSAFIEFYSKVVVEQVYQELNGKAVPQIKQGEIFLAFVETGNFNFTTTIIQLAVVCIYDDAHKMY